MNINTATMQHVYMILQSLFSGIKIFVSTTNFIWKFSIRIILRKPLWCQVVRKQCFPVSFEKFIAIQYIIHTLYITFGYQCDWRSDFCEAKFEISNQLKRFISFNRNCIVSAACHFVEYMYKHEDRNRVSKIVSIPLDWHLVQIPTYQASPLLSIMHYEYETSWLQCVYLDENLFRFEIQMASHPYNKYLEFRLSGRMGNSIENVLIYENWYVGKCFNKYICIFRLFYYFSGCER